MNDYIYYYLLAVNILAFVLFGIDKQKARRNLWRIPEKISGDTGCGDCCRLVYTDNVNNSCLSGSGV